MPARSKAQQRFMGMVRAQQKGEGDFGGDVAQAARSMKQSDVKDYASTRHKGLPDHVEEGVGRNAAIATVLSIAAAYGMADQAREFFGELKANIEAEQQREPSPGRPDPNTSGWEAGSDRVMRPQLEAINRMRKLAGMPPISEDIERVERVQVGHEDERRMLMKNIHQMGKVGIEVYELLKNLPQDADLPHWWQAKIIKAEDYLHSAKHYLENEVAFSQGDQHAHDDQVYDDDYQDPSGVS